jgi:DNA processing protein
MEWFDLWCAALFSRSARLAMSSRACTADDFLRQLVHDRQLPEAWGATDFSVALDRVMRARQAFDQGVALLEERAPVHVLQTRLDPRFQLGTDSPWMVVWGEQPQLQVSLTAVVGTRRLAALPPTAMSVLQSVLQREDTTLVSGGALGVDTTAHRCALAMRRPCVVVLAGGLLWAGPRSNTADFQRILRAGGALVTARPVQWQPGRWEFSERNRLIAALADQVILARAPSKSGARITCDWARTMRRPVFLLPWGANDLCVEGCEEEQRLGSRVLTAELWSSLRRSTNPDSDTHTPTRLDVQMRLNLSGAGDKRPPCNDIRSSYAGVRLEVPAECEQVWRILRSGNLTTDEIMGATSERPSEVLAALSTLELYGLAGLDGSGRWSGCAE